MMPSTYVYVYPFHVFRFDFTKSAGPTLWLEDIFFVAAYVVQETPQKKALFLWNL